MKVTPIKTQLFKKGDNLLDFITTNISTLSDESILVITSKIVSLSQNRVASLQDKGDSIIKGSIENIHTQYGTLTLTDAGWCINAGVDESNADNLLILLPVNPQDIAFEIYNNLKIKYGIEKLGVIISDTRTVPLRKGTIGRAIAVAGIDPIKSYVGSPDLFGRENRMTKSNVADALAAAAVLVMGEGNEQIPLAVINEAPVSFVNPKSAESPDFLSMDPSEDIYRPVFQ